MLRQLFFTTSLALASFVSFTGFSEKAQPASEGIAFFQGTWQEALEKAKKENKIVFLDAYASWCGPCKFLKSNVFTDARVGSYFNEHFVNMEVDMEKGEGKNLARMYAVGAYPTLFFIRPDGSVANKSVGYVSADQLIDLGAKTLLAEKSAKP